MVRCLANECKIANKGKIVDLMKAGLVHDSIKTRSDDSDYINFRSIFGEVATKTRHVVICKWEKYRGEKSRPRFKSGSSTCQATAVPIKLSRSTSRYFSCLFYLFSLNRERITCSRRDSRVCGISLADEGKIVDLWKCQNKNFDQDVTIDLANTFCCFYYDI